LGIGRKALFVVMLALILAGIPAVALNPVVADSTRSPATITKPWAGTSSETSQTAQAILFSDDFQDGNTAGWTTLSGNWEVVGGELVQNDESYWPIIIWTGDETWSDYVIEVKVKPTGGLGHVFVLFRFVDEQNFYLFGIRENSDDVVWNKVVEGNWGQEVTSAKIIDSNQWYDLKVVVQGNNIRGYVDDSLCIETFDSDIHNGAIALDTHLASAHFDDVSVTEIESYSIFDAATVTLQVLDYDGSPLSGAKVKFFSEDWYVRCPDFGWPDPWFFTTDSGGYVSLRLIVGNWTVFAGGGKGYHTAGQGYFAVLRTQITGDCSLALIPDSAIQIAFKDINDDPLDGEIHAMVSEYIPLMAMPPVGVTSGGHITVHVTNNTEYGFSLVKLASLGSPGYLAFANHIGAEQTVEVRMADNCGRITLRFLDSSMEGTTGLFEMIHYGISIDGWAISATLSDQTIFYITPGRIWAGQTVLIQGWTFRFYGNEYDIKIGDQLTLSAGGSLNVKVKTMQYEWGWTGSGLARPQVWLIAKDSFGNALYRYNDPTYASDATVSFLRNGSVFYTERFSGPYIHAQTDGDWLGIRTSEKMSSDDSADYRLEFNAGPFGNFILQGSLLTSETLLEFETITTAHFQIKGPIEFHDKFLKCAMWLERAYGNMSQLMNESLSSMITGDFQIRWGFFGGENQFWFNIADVLMDHYGPSDTINAQLAMGGGLIHELAHVFQFTKSDFANKDNYYVPYWFGEPFASMMAADTLGGALGEAERKFAFGDRNKLDFTYITGEPFQWERDGVFYLPHVSYHYLEEKYGISIHRQMAKEWSNNELKSNRNRLANGGFDQNETYVILYSYVANENLAWLYRSGGISITDQRVEQGLQLLASRTTDHVISVGGEIFHVVTNSNSTLSDLVLDGGQLSFSIAGSSGTSGYCNLTIPKSLMNCADLSAWTVRVNGTELLPPSLAPLSENTTHTFIHFTYTFASTLQVTVRATWVVPELSPLHLAAFIVLLTFTIVFARRKAQRVLRSLAQSR